MALRTKCLPREFFFFFFFFGIKQKKKPRTAQIALSPASENHLRGFVPSRARAIWSQLGQCKYLGSINACDESKTPA